MSARLTAGAIQQFQDKVEAAAGAARANEEVVLRVTTDWDRERFPESPDLVALETVAVPPPGSWIRLTVTTNAPSPAGAVRPRNEQSYVVRPEPALFVTGPNCSDSCDPSFYNPLRFTTNVAVDRTRGATRVPT